MLIDNVHKKIIIGLSFCLSTGAVANEIKTTEPTMPSENQTIINPDEYQAITAEIRQISEEIRQLSQEIQQGKETLRQVAEEQNNYPKLLSSRINLNSVVSPEIRYEKLDSTLQQVADVESEQALLALNEEIHHLSQEIRQLNEEISKGKQELEEIHQSMQPKQASKIIKK